jgi:hypothetical protein
MLFISNGLFLGWINSASFTFVDYISMFLTIRGKDYNLKNYILCMAKIQWIEINGNLPINKTDDLDTP